MKVLVTGGAGFIGRWVVKKLLEEGHTVKVLDDLSNGNLDNLSEFSDNPELTVKTGDIKNEKTVSALFRKKLDLVIHLAADIIVQDSIDNPRKVFENDVIGTFNILEASRKAQAKFVFMIPSLRQVPSPNFTRQKPHPRMPVRNLPAKTFPSLIIMHMVFR